MYKRQGQTAHRVEAQRADQDVINTIPTGIIGGISFVLYGMISAIGVRNVVENLSLIHI